MTDLDKIYECILDKTYQNKSQLEIILSQIEDKDLVVGFIFDMLLKHSKYDVDKQSMLELMAEILGEMKPREYIKNCHNTFNEKLHKMNDEILSENSFILVALKILSSIVDDDNIFGDTDKFEKVVSECKSKEHLEKLKKKLLNAELYEVIGIVDKYL